MKTFAILALGLLLGPAAVPDSVQAAAGDTGGCGISCWNGTSCTVSGTGPCECQCRGFLGLGGASCVCMGAQLDNPAGD
jgi:hypothetical protein